MNTHVPLESGGNTTREEARRDTQHVPLRQNTEEKVREKGPKVVWDDANE